MTKEITKAFILQQMQDKFGLRELEPETFRFSEMVIPTYNIEKHLRLNETLFKDVSITSAAGFTFYTVPSTEKWSLNGYNVVFMASGAYKVTGLYIDRKLSLATSLYLDMTEGQTISYAVNLPKPCELEPGDKIRILVDDYTSTAYLRLYADVLKEEIR